MWQTRTICTFVAATVPVENPTDTNELVEQAKRIGIPDNQPAHDPQQQAAEPKPGTYETFMSTFGNPMRWAGRG